MMAITESRWQSTDKKLTLINFLLQVLLQIFFYFNK